MVSLVNLTILYCAYVNFKKDKSYVRKHLYFLSLYVSFTASFKDIKFLLDLGTTAKNDV